MKYMTPKEAAEKWGISQRRVHFLCGAGRIKGVERHGGVWLIPAEAKKPEDARIKSGLYVKPNPSLPADNPFPEPQANRFFAPVPPSHAVLRPRLLEKIAPPGRKLTYIHADAGYGKTTLLSQYACGCNSLLWLSLEGKDGDVLSFLQHLENSLREKLPQFDFHATHYASFPGKESLISAALPSLLRAIGNRKMTIILDDVHVVDDTTTAFLTEWVKRCPPNVTMIMASRHELWSGLLRLKLEGAIAELTKTDLCFNREEVEKLWGFFDEASYSATEGWPLAIQSCQ